jgi:hypothetical protein
MPRATGGAEGGVRKGWPAADEEEKKGGSAENVDKYD